MRSNFHQGFVVSADQFADLGTPERHVIDSITQ